MKCVSILIVMFSITQTALANNDNKYIPPLVTPRLNVEVIPKSEACTAAYGTANFEVAATGLCHSSMSDCERTKSFVMSLANSNLQIKVECVREVHANCNGQEYVLKTLIRTGPGQRVSKTSVHNEVHTVASAE